MTTGAILLARHGETDAKRLGLVLGRQEMALTEAGRRQAQALADAVAQLGIVRLYASPLGRSVETATIAGFRLALDPALDERLVEAHKGDWEGRERAAVKRAEPELYGMLRRAPEDFRFPGGEALAEVRERVRAALTDIAAGPLPALVVSHNGTIRCAMALGHPDGLLGTRELTVPNGEPIPFDVRWLDG